MALVTGRYNLYGTNQHIRIAYMNYITARYQVKIAITKLQIHSEQQLIGNST